MTSESIDLKDEVADQLIDFLNSLLSLDRHAIQELIALRIPCNPLMAAHPTVQVYMGSARDPFIRPTETRVGLLGLLNGFVGTINAPGESYHQYGPIMALYTDGMLTKFVRTETYRKEMETVYGHE